MENTLEKHRRQDDSRYLARVLPCCACGSEPGSVTPDQWVTVIEAHHRTGAGVALKAGDHDTMPLCLRCHRDFHDSRGLVAATRALLREAEVPLTTTAIEWKRFEDEVPTEPRHVLCCTSDWDLDGAWVPLDEVEGFLSKEEWLAVAERREHTHWAYVDPPVGGPANG